MGDTIFNSTASTPISTAIGSELTQVVADATGLSLPVFGSLPLLSTLFIILLVIAFNLLKNGRNESARKNIMEFFDGLQFGGHRGSPFVYPENTIASMEQALSEGADLIEFDISLTKDGVPVILHDDTLDRTTNMTGPIRSFCFNELQSCNTAAKFCRHHSNSDSALYKFNRPSPGLDKFDRCASEQSLPLPTLKELVDWARLRRIKMIFDVKDADEILMDELAKLFERYSLYQTSVVCSLKPQIVYTLKRRHPIIPTGITWRRWFLSCKDVNGQVPRFKSRLAYWLAIPVDMFYDWGIRSAVLTNFLGADMVLTERAEISESFVKYQMRRNLPVCAWTVNDVHEMVWMYRTLKIPFLTDKPFLVKPLLGAGDISIGCADAKNEFAVSDGRTAVEEVIEVLPMARTDPMKMDKTLATSMNVGATLDGYPAEASVDTIAANIVDISDNLSVPVLVGKLKLGNNDAGNLFNENGMTS